ncbi:MAG TPA: HIT family protein [Candidatus Poseidoniales archaeon]|jgi:histidine triad (HIT) family protein|nr:MAG: HIT family protein [Euryarchaeota archaeon]HIF90863.1 HIT family protein [Candidatus Poseidoniales archaeon]
MNSLAYVMGGTTLFEKIVAGEIPCHRVAEGEQWLAFLDIFPRSQGHTLVIPKQGIQHLSSLSTTQRNELFDGVCTVEAILSAHFNTTDFTICIHDGPLAGQEVPHVHVHVIPRTAGDGGGTLQSMWPNAPAIGGQADHAALADLSKQLGGVQ